jgi:hyperosmotically inducible protein
VALALVTGACAETDAGVTTKVKAKLAADDVVKAHKVDVTTNDHVVTLTGDVESPEVRERAVRLTRETDGVRDVVDELRVVATSRTLDRDNDRADSLGSDVKEGAEGTAGAAKETSEKTGNVVTEGAKATGSAIKKGAEATADGAKAVGSKIKDVFTDKDRDSDKDGK